jgi:hypothetical protein
MASFDELMRMATAAMRAEGFVPDLWVPEFAPMPSESLAFEDPHAPQLLAAYQIFVWSYVSQLMTPDTRVWVHLAAEMQAGKTGVITTLIRLALANRSLRLDPRRIFVTTGMSDEAWDAQTKQRMPACIRDNVHHGATMSKIQSKLEALAEAAEGKQLRDVLIIIYESHYASSAGNQPNRFIYSVVARLCPRARWQENGIRFLTVSATDPAKVLTMQTSEVPTAVVRLQTGPGYQSVERLLHEGRILPVKHLVHEKEGMAALAKEVRTLEAAHGPLVHILRPNHKKGEAAEAALKAEFPLADVIAWDMESNKKRRAGGSDASSVASSSTDINEAYLSEKPQRTMFILLKGMFRAAKTLLDTHVGVLYDRVGGMDSTNLQSLLGRACGYGKSTRTVIFAGESTVRNYLTLWRELCSSRDFPGTVEGIPASKLKGKMPGVLARGRPAAKLSVTAAHASPLGGDNGPAAAGAGPPRAAHDDDDFDVSWSEEFRTAEEARAITGKKMEVQESGFYANAAGRAGPMTREHLVAIRGGKKTAGGRPRPGPSGQKILKTFAFYENPMDTTTVRFVVRTLTRK